MNTKPIHMYAFFIGLNIYLCYSERIRCSAWKKRIDNENIRYNAWKKRIECLEKRG